ncbi:MAG: UDP-N-acetylmuramate--L-alanine ligase [Armatimonadota bacterium]|nr:MAG: UDP-N-acetylmuramate--L-alanine ligase [Armatimonadota bacterium]
MKELRVHFAGIGGIGMSAIAQVLHRRGWQVTGCDLKPSSITHKLQEQGIPVWLGHDPAHIQGCDVFVYTAAIHEHNPELLAARRAGIRVLRRSQALGMLLEGHKGIAITGTHGKTTTTAMVASVLEAAGVDPQVLIGGEVRRYGGNVRLGQGEYVVVEACEAYDSFLDLFPYAAVITNVEAEHLDYYQTEQRMLESYRRFASQVHSDGFVLTWADDPRTLEIATHTAAKVVTFGTSSRADYRVLPAENERVFEVQSRGETLGAIHLRVPGAHNVLNAVAAAGVGLELGLSFRAVREGLESFEGVQRRLEFIGRVKGVEIYDDYGHHPTEIEVTLRTLRPRVKKRLVVAFQPHLYSRTRDFWDRFADVLAEGCDALILVEIYPAREEPIPGICSARLAEEIHSRRAALPVALADTPEQAAEVLLQMVREGDTVLTLGAGELDRTARLLMQLLGGVSSA